MRKLLMKLVSGLMVVGCLFSITACSPKLKIDKAEEALRDKGYEVEIDHDVHDVDYGVDAVIERALYAERDDSWIEIYELKSKKAATLFYEIIEAEREADKQIANAYIEYYEHLLNEYKYEMTSEEIADFEAEIKEYKEDLERYNEDEETSGVNGKYIWFASDADVIKDAK